MEGDEILLNYHAGDAVYLYKNGKERGKFPGLAFKQALFGIWLGGKPADDDALRPEAVEREMKADDIASEGRGF